MNSAEPQHAPARIAHLCTFVALMASSALLPAQTANPADAAELMRSVVANEIAAGQNTSVKFMFHSRRTTQKDVQNRIYAEANEAMATMIVGRTDQPLTAEQERAEADKLAQLASHPDQLRRKQEREKQEMEHTMRVMKALPDAFCYQYAGTENAESGLGKAGAQLIRLNFKPNPSYSPPSSVEQVLQGMEGYILIDAAARRIARIDGTLFREVNFGWGIFGRLDKGGSFRVQQADAGDGNWVVTQMTLKLTGKILLLKSLNLVSDETFEGFQRLPDDLPFAKAVELLQAQEVRLAQVIRPPDASAMHHSRP